MSINIIVSQLGKPAKSMEVESGTTIGGVLDKISMDRAGKSFTVVGDNGAEVKTADYVLQDGDKLRISANNAAA